MGKPYSQDLRERVIATDSGTRVCVAARLFLVSVSYVSRLLAVGARVVRRRRGSGAGRTLAAHDEALRARVTAYPDATLEDCRLGLWPSAPSRSASDASGTGSSFSNLRSKSRAGRRAGSAGCAKARDEWRASQPDLKAERLVFIDETGAATDMARRYGRCPRGQRLVSSVPWGHWRRQHSLPRYVLMGSRHLACSTDRWMVRASVPMWSSPVPILRHDDMSDGQSPEPQGHRHPRAISRRCTARYLPSYSPDFTPSTVSPTQLCAAPPNDEPSSRHALAKVSRKSPTTSQTKAIATN